MNPDREDTRPVRAGEQGVETAGFDPPGLLDRLRARLRVARDIYEGVYVAPYRALVHREYLRQYDLFLLLTFADLLGVPNPVEFYTLELLPELFEQFHSWHLRLGMEHAPEGGFRCC